MMGQTSAVNRQPQTRGQPATSPQEDEKTSNYFMRALSGIYKVGKVVGKALIGANDIKYSKGKRKKVAKAYQKAIDAGFLEDYVVGLDEYMANQYTGSALHAYFDDIKSARALLAMGQVKAIKDQCNTVVNELMKKSKAGEKIDPVYLEANRNVFNYITNNLKMDASGKAVRQRSAVGTGAATGSTTSSGSSRLNLGGSTQRQPQASRSSGRPLPPPPKDSTTRSNRLGLRGSGND